MKIPFLKPFSQRRAVMAGFVVAVALMIPPRSWAGESKTLAVKMANTPIFSEPSMNSAKTATVQTGDLLELIEEAGRFHKVKTSNGDVGYVPRMNVTESEPAAPKEEKEEDEAIDELVGELGEKQALKLEDISASHSVRGKISMAKPTPVINRDAAEKSVEAMESFTVTHEEVMEFRKEGGLEAGE